MRKLILVFCLLILLTGKIFAQSPGQILLGLIKLPPLDTCIHQIPIYIAGYDEPRASAYVTTPSIATIVGHTLYIHNIGATTIVLTSKHAVLGYGDTTGHYLYPDTVWQPETLKYVLQIGTPTPRVKIFSNSSYNCAGYINKYSAFAQDTDATPVYQWQVNGVNVGTNYRVLNINTLKANDMVICTVTNIGPCRTYAASDTSIVQSITPLVSISAVENPVCQNSSAIFNAVVSNAGSSPLYQWFVNGKASGTNSTSFTSSVLNNNDIITCLVSNIGQCVLPATSPPVVIKLTTLPAVNFYGSIKIPFGGSTQLNPFITGNIATYQWSPVDGLSSATIANPIATPKATTIYNLVVTNTGGCQAQASVTVTVAITIPNAFTPNGDGVNDTWNIPALTNYPSCVVNVYNRYGTLIFHSNGYPKAWDGTYVGKALPMGNYYYLIDANNSKFSGSVTIVR